MLVGARHCHDDTSKLILHVDDNKIERVTEQKLLDVFIDEQLSWTSHTDHLCSMTSTKTSQTISRLCPLEHPKDFSKVIYCLYLILGETHGQLHQMPISNIERLQNYKKTSCPNYFTSWVQNVTPYHVPRAGMAVYS